MARKHHAGTTYWLYVTWKDKDGNLIVGGTSEVKIYDPAGTDKTGTPTVTEEGNGIYSLRYEIPEDGMVGEWRVEWKLTYGTKIGIEEHRFEVE